MQTHLLVACFLLALCFDWVEGGKCSATQRWTLVHGVSRKSLKKIIAAKPKEEESQPVLDWYDDKHYEQVMISHEEHPDLAPAGKGAFPANGHGGFAKRFVDSASASERQLGDFSDSLGANGDYRSSAERARTP